jgi:hypothetical protein
MPSSRVMSDGSHTIQVYSLVGSSHHQLTLNQTPLKVEFQQSIRNIPQTKRMLSVHIDRCCHLYFLYQ